MECHWDSETHLSIRMIRPFVPLLVWLYFLVLGIASATALCLLLSSLYLCEARVNVLY